MQFTAAVRKGDADKDFVDVKVLDDAGEAVVGFVIHQSLSHSNTINVEIDHGFDDERAATGPSLRVHYNDTLIVDTQDPEWREAPALQDTREVDLFEEV